VDPAPITGRRGRRAATGVVTIRPTVAVVGAGPAGLAAARRLRVEPGVRVLLVAPRGTADYLPGALAVATGDAGVDRYRVPVDLGDVEVVAATAEAVGPGGVRIDGTDLEAQAVIAAPGLALDSVGGRSDGAPGGTVAFWDLDGAALVAPVIRSFEHGVLTVVIASPLYRCPPAPYGLAIRLARRAADLGRAVRVRLTTPEPRPLAALGSGVSDFLIASCADAGVEVAFDVHPDHEALAAGHVTDRAGTPVPTDLAVVVPPHRAHPLLAAWAGPEPLVAVDDHGRAGGGEIYVAGDAAAGPYPRATGPAVLSGVAAAEGALADLGFRSGPGDTTPELDCFVDRGAGRYGRIRITYPDGPPPGGRSAVEIDPSAPGSPGGFAAALERWRSLGRDPPTEG